MSKREIEFVKCPYCGEEIKVIVEADISLYLDVDAEPAGDPNRRTVDEEKTALKDWNEVMRTSQ